MSFWVLLCELFQMVRTGCLAILAGTCTKYFVINGRKYKILHEIAEGGFSYVYLVSSSNGQFAVKKIVAQSEEQSKNAKWEIRVHKLIGNDSPNLIPLIDSDISREKRGYEQILLLYPFFKKGSLVELLVRKAEQGGELPERVILDMFLQICTGLQRLHSLDPPLAHRDIKAHNILIRDSDNAPVLMDFGSAAPARVDLTKRRNRQELQETAAMHSSMAYRAPELWEPVEDPNCVVDERTDVWSLGCLLFAMLWGQGYSPYECKFPVPRAAFLPTAGFHDLEKDSMSKPSIPAAVPRPCTYLAVIGPIPFPEASSRSSILKEVVEWILNQNPVERPSLGEESHGYAQSKKNI
eukprot:CAMPEP_0203752512 /NCGR_PEP_ID=MMETSP0098-20131031/6429_1 /ASSEMBLY_ACC=CAM_ASM_000208 /TAXON_ID=96639 /ORGANISM=" , Strain NY0313808BC1" /LENGTH=351 /DNA_ID=CAMNT_0050642713 /DNA_START=661 /DNA_END=1717 /DNA_ORIENTATION=+